MLDALARPTFAQPAEGETVGSKPLLDYCRCYECPLLEVRRPVLGAGGLKSGLAIVGEAPGRQEVITGTPFIGPSGKLLDATLADAKVDRKDVYVTNAVLCRSIADDGRDADVPAGALRACRPRLIEELRRAHPRLIVTMGNNAANTMFADLGDKKVSSLIGLTHWNKEVSSYVTPTYHPAAVLRGNTGLYDDIYVTLHRAALLVSGQIPLPDPNGTDVAYTYFVATDTPDLTVTRALSTLADDALRTRERRLAIDVETDNVRFAEHDLILITIASMDHVYCFDARCFDLLHPNARALFTALLADNCFEWVLHNMIFDFNFINYHFGAVPARAVDTMALALALSEKQTTIGLKRLSREWLGAPYYEDEVLKYLKIRDRMSDVPIDMLVKYAAADVYYTIRLVDVLERLTGQEGTLELARTVLVPIQRLFHQMKFNGTKVDLEYCAQLEELWLPEIAAAEEALQDFAESVGFKIEDVVKKPKPGQRLNPSSVPQLRHLFYDILNYDVPMAITTIRGGKGKKELGTQTTSGVFLEENRGKPGIEELSTLRLLYKVLRTYVYGITKDVWVDGRLHPDFKLFGTVSGRITIGRPALQTIPHYGMARRTTNEKAKDLASLIRRMFIPSEGHLFVDADYAGLELRVAWHYSHDEVFGKALMSGDYHRLTAAAILGIAPEEVTKTQRVISKFVTFGILYGRQAKSLAMGELQTDERTAQKYIDRFWSMYPGLQRWISNVREFVVREGYVRSTLGRKRRWNLITEGMKNDIQNQGANMPIQSLASDLCLLSAIKINDTLEERDWGHALFTIHDSIAFEIREEVIDAACHLIHDVMTVPPFPTCAKFDVEVGVGPNWAELTERTDIGVIK